MARYAIGLDYGTLSVRAVLIDIRSGETVSQSVYEYPHGVMDRLPGGEALPPGWALQHPRDYLDGLRITVRAVMKESGAPPEAVAGIGLCFTSATILPICKDGTPLCLTREFENEPHAWVKMWKHHAAEPEAEEITRAARARGEKWLAFYGGKVSAEWTVPKVLETLRHAPRVYEEADRFVEAMDWIARHLTGRLTASGCAMGYKALMRDGRFPDREFFAALDPRMADLVRDKFAMPVIPAGGRAGELTHEAAAELGLMPGTPVGTPLIDGHASTPGCGATRPGTLVIIMGTSACHLTLSDRDAAIPGIQGCVRDGILPGLYGVEAGQACVGDHFAWAVKNCLPESYAQEARRRSLDAHQLLAGKLKKYRPGQSGLIALDWFNGVRTPLMDYDLNGLILGLDLKTKPEDIYLSLIEATAYGTRGIVESFEKAGIPVNDIVLAGGVPEKNPLVPRIYADVLGRPVEMSAVKQASALGAAIAGIAAATEEATGYASMSEAAESLGGRRSGTFRPDPERNRIYDGLYADYVTLQEYFGRGGNDVMKRLNRLRREMR